MDKWQLPLEYDIILRALEHSPCSFQDLLQRCNSLMPNRLLQTLEKMECDQWISYCDNLYSLHPTVDNPWYAVQSNWRKNLQQAHALIFSLLKELPSPHCLDYEWWFSDRGRENIAKSLLFANPLPTPRTIVFVGSPVFGAFVSQLLPRTTCYFLDKSSVMLETIQRFVRSKNTRFIHYDVQKPLPSHLVGIADMVFFDPPWYRDYYEVFMRRSSLLTEGKNATIGFIILPVLARSCALEERSALFNIAASMNLHTVALYPNEAQYEVPLFEEKEIKEDTPTLHEWRSGDLALCISQGNTPVTNKPSHLEAEWMEFCIGHNKIKLRVKAENTTKYIRPRLLSWGNHQFVVPTMNRNDTIRDEIDLWTSSQYGFKIEGWKSIKEILIGLERSYPLRVIFSNIRKMFPYEDISDIERKHIEQVWYELRRYLVHTYEY